MNRTLSSAKDVDEMLRGQPDVHRVGDGPIAGYAEVELEMTLVVQGEAG